MYRIFLIFILSMVACTPLSKLAYKAEEEHYALYKQRALIVFETRKNKVFFVNPPLTRYYFLKGKKYVQKWHEGDTMIIDSNLIDFYELRYIR